MQSCDDSEPAPTLPNSNTRDSVLALTNTYHRNGIRLSLLNLVIDVHFISSSATTSHYLIQSRLNTDEPACARATGLTQTGGGVDTSMSSEESGQAVEQENEAQQSHQPWRCFVQLEGNFTYANCMCTPYTELAQIVDCKSVRLIIPIDNKTRPTHIRTHWRC